MDQMQPPATTQVPVMVKPLDKFKIGMNLSMFKISFHQYGRRLNFYQALIAAESIRDTHILNRQDLSNFKKQIPSADDLGIFNQVALIIHRHRKAKKFTGATVFADQNAGDDAGSEEEFIAHYTRVIDILQRDIDAQIEALQEGQDPRIIELIRDYLRYFKVLSPEDIQNLIKFLRLSIYQRKTQQDSLRAEVISIFGNVVSGIETHENGIDAYIFVLQTLDGLTGSEIDLRNKILTHIRSWGITNTESAQNQFAILEQYLKLAGKFGVEMSSAELKRNIIETLLSSNQKLPMQLIAIATNHRINSSSHLSRWFSNLIK